MPFSLHAPRHIGMEEVGWWGDPRRWDYRHASMRRQAWRRLGGGETRVRGLYSRSRTLDFCFQVTSAADFGNIGSDGAATSVGVLCFQLRSVWKWTRLIPWWPPSKPAWTATSTRYGRHPSGPKPVQFKPVSRSVAGRTSHRLWVPRYLFDNGLWRLGGCMSLVSHGLVH